MARAFKRISRRNYKGDLLDFNSSDLGFKGVLGKLQRAKDLTLGDFSLEGNSVK
jgi:hypothetical protein